jgi:hypothetical protein
MDSMMPLLQLLLCGAMAGCGSGGDGSGSTTPNGAMAIAAGNPDLDKPCEGTVTARDILKTLNSSYSATYTPRRGSTAVTPLTVGGNDDTR